MRNDGILFWDIESTGLSVYRDKIITISFILNGKSRTFMVDPEIQIPEQASRIHGIYDKDVKGLPTFKTIAPTIIKILESCDCYCFFNGRQFDHAMLYIELLRCGYNMPNKNIIDVYELVQSLFKSLKLKDIYRVLLKKNFNSHNSLDDTVATMELYYYIMENFLNEYHSIKNKEQQ